MYTFASDCTSQIDPEYCGVAMFSSTVACGEKSAWCPLVVNSIGSSYPVPLTNVNCFVVVVNAGLNTATISVRNALSYKFNSGFILSAAPTAR